MLDVGDFRGDAAEAARFVNDCWSRQFPQDVTCPQWDEAYFEWQMFSRRGNIVIGAYRDGRLVGSLFGEPLGLKWKGREVGGVLSSWLSADPDLKGTGIAKAVAAEMERRLRALGLEFSLGFAVPGPGSLGPKFWTRSEGAVRTPGIHPWIRPVDSGKLAEAAGDQWERRAARLAGALGLERMSDRPHPHVRPYEEERDLHACLDLITRAEAGADLCYSWTPERLAHQLSYRDIPTTFVFDDNGIRGFVNFHRLWFRGAGRFSAGMIDHVIGADAGVEAALMQAALNRVRELGHALAVCPNSSSASVSTLLRHRFVPMPKEYGGLFHVTEGGTLDYSELRRMKVHLR